MPWISPQFVPFTRIGIVAHIPSESGVFGLRSEDGYLLIAESWNLKARLLDLINTLTVPAELTVVYELCSEPEAEKKRDELQRELIVSASQQPPPDSKRLPGISFWFAPDAIDRREL